MGLTPERKLDPDAGRCQAIVRRDLERCLRDAVVGRYCRQHAWLRQGLHRSRRKEGE